MPRPPRYKPRDTSRRRLWIYLAVVAFLLVDALLITWALGSRTPGVAATTPRPIPTFTPESSATSTPTAAPATAAIRPTRILSALDDTTAWRATTGECPAVVAVPEFTTDAGQTWQATDATKDVQLTAPQTINVLSDSQVEIVGLAAEDCSPQFVRSFVAGEDYSTNTSLLDDQWYIYPADPTTVHTPSGDVAAPCASVVDLANRPDDNGAAAITCGDTNVYTTTDFGETWSVPLKGDGIVNLAVTEMGYLLVTVGLPECAGVQLIALSVNPTTATPTGCLPVDVPAETMQGNVAVAEAADTIWVWVGDSVMRSIDQGTSWQ
jgi:hypothetical protein